MYLLVFQIGRENFRRPVVALCLVLLDMELLLVVSLILIVLMMFGRDVDEEIRIADNF